MPCPTCLRPTPQRDGDPALGRCPSCGSTLGLTLDDGRSTAVLVRPGSPLLPMKEYSATIESSGATPYTRGR